MDNKGIIPAAGVAVIGTALQIAAQVWPETIKPHPYWLGGLVIAGAVMLLSPVFKWGLGRGKPSDQALPSVQINPVISPTVSLVFAPVFNNVSPNVPAEMARPATNKPPERRPNFTLGWGSRCNVCIRDERRHAEMMRMIEGLAKKP